MAALSEAHVQGKLKRKLELNKDTDFMQWQGDVTSYLREFRLEYLLHVDFRIDLKKGDVDEKWGGVVGDNNIYWNELKLYNRDVAYGYLTSQMTLRELKGAATSSTVDGDFKKAWIAIETRAHKLSSADLDNSLRDWETMKTRYGETATEFIDRMEELAEKLAKLSEPRNERAKAGRLRAALHEDKRYRNAIGSAVMTDRSYDQMKQGLLTIDKLSETQRGLRRERSPERNRALHAKANVKRRDDMKK